jgi:hypothetical protein
VSGIADYLDRPKRSLAEVLAARIEPNDRVVHDLYGPGIVSIVLIAAERAPNQSTGGRPAAALAEALVHFDNGQRHMVALDQLTKIAGAA